MMSNFILKRFEFFTCNLNLTFKNEQLCSLIIRSDNASKKKFTCKMKSIQLLNLLIVTNESVLKTTSRVSLKDSVHFLQA